MGSIPDNTLDTTSDLDQGACLRARPYGRQYADIAQVMISINIAEGVEIG